MAYLLGSLTLDITTHSTTDQIRIKTMTITLEQTIASMLTENTGANMLDSGGANGRAWQRNLGKTVEDFRAKPSAYAEVYLREWQGNLTAEVMPCVDVFHLLTSGVLELDDLCDEFNAMPVDDWGGNNFTNGVSSEGDDWLELNGFELKGDEGFNTYNWASNHSQVMQGQVLTLDRDGEETYVLLQIHGGADVRGGYTDAKLFKFDFLAEFYNLINEDCGFSDEEGENSLSWHGEWINAEGTCADDDELLAFALACGASLENPSVVVEGDAYLDY